MIILVTGSAGFIGSALVTSLLEQDHKVLGVDNMNNYYDQNLKKYRLKKNINHKNYTNFNISIENYNDLYQVFSNFKIDKVINLAAQAGVRYSIDSPSTYIQTNLVGFFNILECCKIFHISHLIYASSSSIYGLSKLKPFSVNAVTDHPVSLYAATKKSNELMAHSYSHLYDIPSTGLRFFTVYGPLGRPDMAIMKFTNSILKNKSIDLYNFGNHQRDFTYIDDVIDGINLVVNNPPAYNTEWNSEKPESGSSSAKFNILNIGSGKPIKLMKFVDILERLLNKKAKINFLPMQPGDVEDTFADITKIKNLYGFYPKTSIEDGVKNFINWYLSYYL